MKLSEMTDIQLGFQPREQRQANDSGKTGSHRVIQIKDVDSSGALLTRQLSKTTPTGKIERYLVTKGDVLFLSRGQKNVAILIEESLQNTLASYYFYILRANLTLVLPEYLCWFINQPSAQTFLESVGQGSLIKMIPKSIFKEWAIPLPSLKAQKAIAELGKLQKKEVHTMERLVQSRKRFINGLALRAAMGEIQI